MHLKPETAQPPAQKIELTGQSSASAQRTNLQGAAAGIATQSKPEPVPSMKEYIEEKANQSLHNEPRAQTTHASGDQPGDRPQDFNFAKQSPLPDFIKPVSAQPRRQKLFQKASLNLKEGSLEPKISIQAL